MAGIFGDETTDAIGKLLAGEHMRDDPSIRRVYRIDHDTEIRLIEVTTSVPPTGEVLPFRFTAEPGVPFQSLVVLLHPDDWDRRSDLVWPPELNPDTNDVELIAEAPDAA